jgi:phage shock protein C
MSPVRFTTLRLRNAERNDQVMESIHSSFHQAGLVRPQEGRVLAGVFAGLGRRFGLDPWPARLLFVLILLIVPGSQLLIYPVLWILMPNEAPAATFRPVTPGNEAASAA